MTTQRPLLLRACACGCGEEMTVLDGRGRPRRFVSGHNSRGTSRRTYQHKPVNCGQLTPKIGKRGGSADRCPRCNREHVALSRNRGAQ